MKNAVIKVDSQEGKFELEKLQRTKLGETRLGQLFPSIPTSMEWRCTRVKDGKLWEFEGSFCGIIAMTMLIQHVADSLFMEVKEEEKVVPVQENLA
jgi:hypothetical protein